MKKIAGIFLGGFLLFLALSCGRKGPLQEPVPRIPQKVTDFKAVQAGDKIIFSWSPPVSYLDGRQLEVVAKEIYGLELALPPSSTQEMLMLLKKARPVRTLGFGQVSIEKDQAVLTLRPEKVAGQTYLFALKVKGKKGGWSEFSNPVVVTIDRLPHPVVRAMARAGRNSLRLARLPDGKEISRG